MASPDSRFTHFLLTSPTPYVCLVQINRPSKLNAFDDDMFHELSAVFRQLSHDPSVRAIVFSAVGDRAFTAGLDVQAASQNAAVSAKEGTDVARQATALRRHIDDYQTCVGEIERCEKPVICVLHGISYGLAIDMAACADVRICSRDVRLAVKEVDIGLAADVGSLARLPKVVGSMSWLKDVCYSAREFGAEEALRVGFVSEVCESKEKAVEAAVKMAGVWAGKSPVAVQGTKELLNHARDHSVQENLRYTSAWNAAAVQSDDVKVAMLSGLQRKVPKFAKL